MPTGSVGERYHELSRSGDDVPLDYGVSANELFFLDMLNGVLEKQQPMTLLEKDFLEENMTKIDSKEKKSYNG
ncbi:MAG: hypothetical protein Q4C97_05790 [Bacillota bacterium]|nr:hypothetical protein [Bacillota bacterium]